MGAVASCLSSIVSSIGRAIMAILNGIVSVCGAIVNAISTALIATFHCIADVICCRCGGRGGGRARGRKI